MKILLLCILISLSTATKAEEFTFSAGLGYQFGGGLGVQSAYVNDDTRYRVSLSLLGATAGYDYALNEHVSFGLQLGWIVGAEGAGININYFPNRTFDDGFVVGLDFLYTTDPEFPFVKDNEPNSTVLLSIGYQF